jgi:parallel beta-helix repeat protein
VNERQLSAGSTALEGNRQQRRSAARRSRKVAALGSGAMLAVSAAGVATTLMSAAPATAATPIQVTSLLDDGTGTTLREAIDQANTDAGKDTITFQTGLTGTITLLSDLPHITDAVDVQGPGASVIAVSGDDKFAIFNFYDISSSAGSNSVSGLTITHGVANNGDGSSGGGIVVHGGSANMTIADSVITANYASNDGGGVQFYSAVGSELITGTTISGNTADAGGGGLYADSGKGSLSITIQNSTISGNTAGSDGGGLYFDAVDVTIVDSQITGNTAGSRGGGISQDGGSLSITNSLISGNQSTSDGGGLFLYNANPTIVATTISGNTASEGDGGGVSLYDEGTDSTFTMRNSTVSGNTAQYYGGGLYIDVSGASTIENSTISGNTGSQAGGVGGVYGGLTLTQTTITNNSATNPDNGTAVGGVQITGPTIITGAGSKQAHGAAESEKKTANELVKEVPRVQKSGVRAAAVGTVESVGTIIAGNLGEDVGVSSGAATVNSDHSVLGTVDAAVTVNNLGGTQSGVTNPGLAPLAANGGPTQTHALLATSVALNKGPVPVPVFPGNEFDQRGPGFLRVVDGVVDVGAFEVQPPPPPPTPSPLVIQPKFTG